VVGKFRNFVLAFLHAIFAEVALAKTVQLRGLFEGTKFGNSDQLHRSGRAAGARQRGVNPLPDGAVVLRDCQYSPDVEPSRLRHSSQMPSGRATMNTEWHFWQIWRLS